MDLKRTVIKQIALHEIFHIIAVDKLWKLIDGNNDQQ